LFFRVFTIITRENNVSVKYKTKNIKTACKEVFLATINHKSANTISSRNLSPRDTRLNKVWLSGSFVCPLRKIRIVIRAITEKEADNARISPVIKFSFVKEFNRNDAAPANPVIKKSIEIYFMRFFKAKMSLDKIFDCHIDSSKHPEKGEYYSKNRLIETADFIQFSPPPGSYQYNTYHLKGYS
jgi:hypothetical protein